MRIELTFENALGCEFDELETHFRFLSEIVFNHLHLDDYFIYEVDLVDKDTIQEINRDYRNKDRVTDVISFAFEDNEEVLQNGFPRVLGEIFICIDKAKEQAEEYHHSFKREVSFLFVHGLLHLLGYDHMNESDEKVMFALQDAILDPLKL